MKEQIKTYTNMIRSNPNWIFAGVFFDIESGLRRSGRKNLDKMLRKAAKGEIDYIITKSISRVSRDTLEILQIIRFLRERGINMHFEKCRVSFTEFLETLDKLRTRMSIFMISRRSHINQEIC